METVFSGRERMMIDDKGRVPIPARYLAILRLLYPDQWNTLGGIVTQNGSLKIVPKSQYDEYVAQLVEMDEDLPGEDAQSALAGVYELDLDNQNRLKLKREMLEDVGISTDPRQDRPVVFAGAGKHFHLWDETAWNHYREQSKPALAQINTRIAEERRAAKKAAAAQGAANPVSQE